MSDRSFLECWRLNFDDMEFVEASIPTAGSGLPFNSGSSGHMGVSFP